eukprot:TRINITY_DN964_c1_g1_i1.p1 TRINITY_DN964_c1_g1~~TRINITY_DN964_c1_g1_i1.p1  ORF type:complete len:288 (+),score=120.05 TRINITY_DN964_c1_g1_i1:83-865(+)
MEVVSPVVCQLANFEVFEAVSEWRKRRRAENIQPSAPVFKSERLLLRSQVFKDERDFQSRSGSRDAATRRVSDFLSGLDALAAEHRQQVNRQYKAGDDRDSGAHREFAFSEAERLQLLNQRPTTPTQVYLVMDSMEQRVRAPFCAAMSGPSQQLREQLAGKIIALVADLLLPPPPPGAPKEKRERRAAEPPQPRRGKRDDDSDGSMDADALSALLAEQAKTLRTASAPEEEAAVEEEEEIEEIEEEEEVEEDAGADPYVT